MTQAEQIEQPVRVAPVPVSALAYAALEKRIPQILVAGLVEMIEELIPEMGTEMEEAFAVFNQALQKYDDSVPLISVDKAPAAVAEGVTDDAS